MGSDPIFRDFNAIPTDQYVGHRDELVRAYRAVRHHSNIITAPFSEAEQQIQSMPDASPAKWHLAHTTWFFETFILARFQSGFKWFNDSYRYLFNSYYNAIGAQYPRPKRGMITSPNLELVWAYRRAIDQHMLQLLATISDDVFDELAPTLVLGLNHEQQHQELIATDIKHALFQSAATNQNVAATSGGKAQHREDGLDWQGGKATIGYCGDGFCFDNEKANHDVLLPPFRISQQLVTAGEWLEFISDGGYQRPLLWLSDGWQWQQETGIEVPGYWQKIDGNWCQFETGGWTRIAPNEPVRHISYYEADAFAQWAGARLPRETEWECLVAGSKQDALRDLWQCWEWTQSPYTQYPGFKPTPGAAGEYNGKFMVNQMVLRGASPATAKHHSRPSYRNFFYPQARWQFTGLRLAWDIES